MVRDIRTRATSQEQRILQLPPTEGSDPGPAFPDVPNKGQKMDQVRSGFQQFRRESHQQRQGSLGILVRIDQRAPDKESREGVFLARPLDQRLYSSLRDNKPLASGPTRSASKEAPLISWARDSLSSQRQAAQPEEALSDPQQSPGTGPRTQHCIKPKLLLQVSDNQIVTGPTTWQWARIWILDLNGATTHSNKNLNWTQNLPYVIAQLFWIQLKINKQMVSYYTKNQECCRLNKSRTKQNS